MVNVLAEFCADERETLRISPQRAVRSPLRDEMVHGVLPDQPAETFGAQQSMFLKTEQGASLVITQDRTAT
jgi:hypothetical protein